MSRRIDLAGSYSAAVTITGTNTTTSPSSGVICLTAGTVTLTMANGGTVALTSATANQVFPLSVVGWNIASGTWALLY